MSWPTTTGRSVGALQAWSAFNVQIHFHCAVILFSSAMGRIMRHYFHLLTDRERLRDPDGEEFPTLAEACEEATPKRARPYRRRAPRRSCRSLAMEYPDL